MRPVIGLSTALERARWGPWDRRRTVLARCVLRRRCSAAGGIAVLLPPDPYAREDPEPWLDLLDGLIITGGADIDPGRVRCRAHPRTTRDVPERDAFEIALARGAMERDLPLLGVCRGMQVMNVARGGTLSSTCPRASVTRTTAASLGSFDDADHEVRLATARSPRASPARTLHSTKSHHHQGVDRVGEGLEVTGWATMDACRRRSSARNPVRPRRAVASRRRTRTSQLIPALVEEARTRAVR